MTSLLIRPEAEADIEEAYRWNERQRSGLGSDFLLCVEEGLDKIQKNPEM
jgi:toxin ParE1/3/4